MSNFFQEQKRQRSLVSKNHFLFYQFHEFAGNLCIELNPNISCRDFSFPNATIMLKSNIKPILLQKLTKNPPEGMVFMPCGLKIQFVSENLDKAGSCSCKEV